jgi:hypothetical protein
MKTLTPEEFHTIKTQIEKEKPKKIKVTTLLKNYITGELSTETTTKRLFYHDRYGACVYRKGSSRTGDAFIYDRKYVNVVLVQNETPEQLHERKKKKWGRDINTIITKLSNSGLWQDFLQDAKTAKAIGYDTIKSVYNLDTRKLAREAIAKEKGEDYKPDYNETSQKEIEVVKNIEPRLVQEYISKDDGKKYDRINTTILWKLSGADSAGELKIKKMRFYNTKWSKEQNERAMQEVANAFANNAKTHVSGRTSYDVTFEYKPADETKDFPRAWYSEEFKDCGNGHYYLALDATHAVYYERD